MEENWFTHRSVHSQCSRRETARCPVSSALARARTPRRVASPGKAPSASSRNPVSVPRPGPDVGDVPYFGADSPPLPTHSLSITRTPSKAVHIMSYRYSSPRLPQGPPPTQSPSLCSDVAPVRSASGYTTLRVSPRASESSQNDSSEGSPSLEAAT